MNVQNAQADIPLHCNLCPKRPEFSDVSHLLTHIASKGHLSNEFRIRVKARSDLAVQADVQQYDDWFRLYNVQDLMAERMRQKEAKGKGIGGNSRRAVTAAPRPTRSIPAPAAHVLPTTRLHSGMLDPSLDPRVKDEQYPLSVPPNVSYPIEPNPFHCVYIPSLQSWSGSPFTDVPYLDSPVLKQESQNSIGSDDDASYEMEPEHSTRRSARRRINSSNDEIIPTVESCEMEDTIVDGSKMKGVFWPGMAMFDSATPDMKRKRNQKKSYSVVKQLQATSELVTPTELVFDAVWVHRRTRTITGNPEDVEDSHLEGESSPEPEEPTKKKPTRRPRQPLTERNINTGRLSRRRSHAPRTSLGNKQPVRAEEDFDDDLTYQRSRRPRHLSMMVHRDEASSETTPSDATRVSMASSTTYNPFQGSGSQGFENYPANPLGMTQPQPMPGHEHFTSMGNFRPANEFSSLLTHSLASFGHLNFSGQSIFPPGGVGGGQGHVSFSGFAPHHNHQYGSGGQFCGHGMLHSNALASWDNYLCGNQDPNVSNMGNPTYHAPTDTTMPTLNALFMSADDDGTVSPPGSERE